MPSAPCRVETHLDACLNLKQIPRQASKPFSTTSTSLRATLSQLKRKQRIRRFKSRFPKHYQQRQLALVQSLAWKTLVHFEVNADGCILERRARKLCAI